ncbi:hypothetical protein HGRIS_011873 [Hohenbuehelia grisea]|uniref:HMG box domain-containing protein n=1 Tax=Hohenbuehelia grisea TaxID=104357 RepID=A0ABR3JWL1_9AGAR
MPAVRLSSRRRRSSLGIALNPAKAGTYGITSPPPRPVTFAPNVTPGTYIEPEDDEDDDYSPESSSPKNLLFPPTEVQAPVPARPRRVPPGKRRSLGYIPRPPNAFMLFRANFVRQKHVPGSIETNHGSLSKIIGETWKAAPLEERRVWEAKAKQAKAEHKAKYPDYRFRPVHNKNKDKKKVKPQPSAEDEQRCTEVAHLLLQGKKGDDLAAAVRDLDNRRATPSHQSSPQPQPQFTDGPLYPHRRSSSVPLPDYFPMHSNMGIALPSVPFFSSRAPSPVHSISRSQRMMLGQRRASSARPSAFRSWTMPTLGSLARDDSPLPDVDTSLFESSFLDATNSNFSFPVYDNAAPFAPSASSFVSPLDSVPPDFSVAPSPVYTSTSSVSQPLPEIDPMGWYAPAMQQGQAMENSQPSTAYSGSPAPELPDHGLPVVHAPQPQSASASVFTDLWQGVDSSDAYHQGYVAEQQQQPSYETMDPNQATLGLHFTDASNQMQFSQDACGTASDMSFAPVGLDSLFEQPNYGGFGYDYHDMDQSMVN